MITVNDVLKFAPRANKNFVSDLVKWFNHYAPTFEVNTPERIRHFLAQAAHETDGFKVLREYASGKAYEGRKDLGNIVPGDGMKFKGRGIFMYTGRTNYRAVSKKIFGDERLLQNPEILEVPQYAVLSAFIYWDERNLNSYADKGDLKGITRKINGGYNGLKDRENYFEKLMQLSLSVPGISVVALLLIITVLYFITLKN